MGLDDFLIRTTIRIEVETNEGLCTGTGFFISII